MNKKVSSILLTLLTSFLVLGVLLSCSQEDSSTGSAKKTTAFVENALAKLNTVDTSNLSVTDKAKFQNIISEIENDVLPASKNLPDTEADDLIDGFEKFSNYCDDFENKTINVSEIQALKDEYNDLMNSIKDVVYDE